MKIDMTWNVAECPDDMRARMAGQGPIVTTIALQEESLLDTTSSNALSAMSLSQLLYAVLATSNEEQPTPQF